jgi:hypothetical protein
MRVLLTGVLVWTILMGALVWTLLACIPPASPCTTVIPVGFDASAPNPGK